MSRGSRAAACWKCSGRTIFVPRARVAWVRPESCCGMRCVRPCSLWSATWDPRPPSSSPARWWWRPCLHCRGPAATSYGRRFCGDGKALVAGVLVALIALLAIVGPSLSPFRYDALDWHHLAVPPQLQSSHWLGTDRLGRDLFVRTLYGVR